MVRWLARWPGRRTMSDLAPQPPHMEGTTMDDELDLYDVEVNGAETTLQLSAAEAALRFPDAKPRSKARAAKSTTDTPHPTHVAADDSAVSNKARRTP